MAAAVKPATGTRVAKAAVSAFDSGTAGPAASRARAPPPPRVRGRPAGGLGAAARGAAGGRGGGGGGAPAARAGGTEPLPPARVRVAAARFAPAVLGLKP